MLRKGRYAVVNRKEYSLFSYNGQLYLKSTNCLELANGFTPWREKKGVFIKKVRMEELEDAYEVFSFVMLNSHRFAVDGIDVQTKEIFLVTSNPFVQQKMNVKPYGPDEYVMTLPLSQVCLQEERISILGFENKHSLISNIM